MIIKYLFFKVVNKNKFKILKSLYKKRFKLLMVLKWIWLLIKLKEDSIMAKGQDKQKNEKKKGKTLKEKRAAKKEKK